jgi:hypothetical protein
VYVIQLRKNGEWTDWTSTANRSRIPLMLSLARIVHPRKPVRWIKR